MRGVEALDVDGERPRLSVTLFGVEENGTGKFMDVTPHWDKEAGPPAGFHNPDEPESQ